MSDFDREQVQMEAVIADMRKASALQVVGWTLLVFDVLIIAMWLFTAQRSGSAFWLYWFVIEGALGLALIMAGSYFKTRAGRHVNRRESSKIRRVA